MLVSTQRGPRRLVVTVLLSLTLGACGDAGEPEDSSDPSDPSAVDVDIDNADVDPDTGSGNGGGSTASTGGPLSSATGGTAAAAADCDNGYRVGARCVKKEHVVYVEEEPQPTDPGELVYDFDQNYKTYGALKKNAPKIPPNADLGAAYMYEGDFVRLGVAYKSFIASAGPVSAGDLAVVGPYRDARNKELPYNLNAVSSGGDIAAPNCTVCHSSYFEGKLVQGLGRNNHFIGTDASGFTLNVLGIGVNSVLKGDIGTLLSSATTLLGRLFKDAAGHSHLFDLFAALGMRHDPNTLKWTGKLWGDPNSGLKGWIDFPAWWNLKKKHAMYSTGAGRGYKADHLLYMSWFSVDGLAEAEEIQNNFVHVQKWIEEDIKPPKFESFGGKIDQSLADAGEAVFTKNCAFCHGTYSENEDEETYPNFIIDVDEVGTDPRLATNHWIYPVKPWYDASWYGKRGTSTIVKTHGYMPPPLDGVFITAPYFHNGSVPTLEGVLDSTKRPKSWTSNQSDGDYDFKAIGWKNKPGDLKLLGLNPSNGIQLIRGNYDTTKPGNSNKGHTYGDALNADEKRAVLEYLKTL